MPATSFPVWPEVKPNRIHERVDCFGKLRTALRRPIEATWLPREPLIACDEDHALLTAMQIAFYDHYPLRLSPDAIWTTLARGFALHVNEHAEELRHQFVSAKDGNEDAEFWMSMFRYNSGSGPAVMTGWGNVLFPYFKDYQTEKLYPNPFLKDWKERLEIDENAGTIPRALASGRFLHALLLCH